MNYGDQTLDEFLSAIASKHVIPAGGTATAVVGAIGATLLEMVCIHTLEKDEHGDVAAEVAEVRDELRRERGHLMELAVADARVVGDLFPPSDENLDQSTVKQSIGVPHAIADACLNVLHLATDVTAKGNRNAIADAGTGILLARSALRAAVFTARSNLNQVPDPSFVTDIRRRTTALEADADDAYERAMEHIEARR